MPTYDYQCDSCGHAFEYFQNMSDDPLQNCPECGSNVKRLIGGGLGVIFKGSGFYVTDNKGSQSAAGKSNKKDPPAKTEKTKPAPSKEPVSAK